MIKIIVHGYQGKMGRLICDLAANDPDCQICAGLDVKPPSSAMPFPVYESVFDCDMPSDVIIDFSVAKAVPAIVEYAISKSTGIVLCTTGLEGETVKLIESASKAVPVFLSANMSLGINLIASLAGFMSPALSDAGFDIEILEKHHNQKIDAPSGTAYLLGDAIKASLDNDYDYVYDRSQTREKRGTREIGISAVRGGTIPGEHSVIFAGRDEVIELKHTVYSKEVFAVGALKAAKFLAGKPPGMYSMKDVFVI